jgi:carbon-monoxide dehydrogenase medium subunit
MKPAQFHYHRPETVERAVSILGEFGDDGQVLAGGHSLVPIMAFRLATPEALVDINRVSELDYLTVDDGVLRIGALTRHARFHAPVCDAPLGALLSQVVRHVAHWPIRTRGTFCGSLAHVDPAAEWCVVLACLDGMVTARGPQGSRDLAAPDLFEWAMTSSLEPGEILTEARLPLLPDATRWGFYEVARRAGDYALAMACATYRVDDQGRIAEPRVALGGIEPVPRRVPEAEQALAGAQPSADAFQAAAAAAAEAVDPMEDIQADAAYRRDLTRASVRRALARSLPA